MHPSLPYRSPMLHSSRSSPRIGPCTAFVPLPRLRECRSRRDWLRGCAPAAIAAMDARRIRWCEPPWPVPALRSAIALRVRACGRPPPRSGNQPHRRGSSGRSPGRRPSHSHRRPRTEDPGRTRLSWRFSRRTRRIRGGHERCRLISHPSKTNPGFLSRLRSNPYREADSSLRVPQSWPRRLRVTGWARPTRPGRKRAVDGEPPGSSLLGRGNRRLGAGSQGIAGRQGDR